MLLCMTPRRVGVETPASSAGSRGGVPPGASPAEAASTGAQHGQRESGRARQQRARYQHALRDRDAVAHASAAPAGRLRRLSALGNALRASRQDDKAACEVLPGRRCAVGEARAAAARAERLRARCSGLLSGSELCCQPVCVLEVAEGSVLAPIGHVSSRLDRPQSLVSMPQVPP